MICLSDLLIVPRPQTCEFSSGHITIDSSWKITCTDYRLTQVEVELQELLLAKLHIEVPLSRTGNSQINLALNESLQEQEYKLVIKEASIQIIGGSVQGVHYGFVTLKQIIMQSGSSLPTLKIHDWPAFEVRGFMHDIGRLKIPKIETVYRMIDILSDLKINQFQLYMEGYCFEYEQYKQNWPVATPITKEEMQAIDRYAKQKFIELVPNQNSFGHMEKWLNNDAFSYLSLYEESEGNRGSTLDPTNPASFHFVRNLFNELLPAFSSNKVNINFDEPFDFGRGKSKELSDEVGVGNVYVQFFEKLYQLLAKEHGKSVMLWGDVLMNHPEMLDRLPKDITLLDWGYDQKMKTFEKNGPVLQASGIDFYFCPGTSAWHSLAGKTDNMMNNIEDAVVAGKKYGAKGILNTDWGDVHGNWHYLPISYPGMVYGAQLSWNVENKGKADLVKYLDRFIFKDEQEQIGQLLLDIGNYFQLEGYDLHDATMTYNTLTNGLLSAEKDREIYLDNLWALREYFDIHFDQSVLNHYDFAGFRELIADAKIRLEQSVLQCDDKEIVYMEIQNTIRFIEHAVTLKEMIKKDEQNPTRFEKMKSHLLEILSAHEPLWRYRNKGGNYEISIKTLQSLLTQYEDMIENEKQS